MWGRATNKPHKIALLYILSNVAYLNILPFAGDPNGADALARGIQHAAQDRVRIPMSPGADSLNVHAAAAILLYEIARQRASR